MERRDSRGGQLVSDDDLVPVPGPLRVPLSIAFEVRPDGRTAIGQVSITIGNKTLQEGVDFTVDHATGVVTFIGGHDGTYQLYAPSWPKPARQRGRAQWKAERRGFRP
jgi:hypothetical protein